MVQEQSLVKHQEKLDKRDIGQWFVKFDLESFLRIGITLAVFKRVGKVPIVKKSQQAV